MSFFKESSRDISVLLSSLWTKSSNFYCCSVEEFCQLTLAGCKNKFSTKRVLIIMCIIFISLEVECVGTLLVPEVICVS